MPTPARSRPTQAPSRHVYDVAVIGSQLSGVIAACLLARRGMHVLYVEHDGMGRGYTHGEWLLPCAPFVLPPLKAIAGFEEALGELGLLQAVQRAARLPSPMLQLVAPRLRVDLSADPARRKAELERTGSAPGATEAWWAQTVAQLEKSEGFLREKPGVPADGFFERFKLGRKIAAAPGLRAEPAAVPDAAVPRALQGLLPFLGFSAAPTGLAAMRPLALGLQGLQLFPGGREGLRDVFLDRLRELGGDVLAHDEGTLVEALATEGKAIVGLKLLKGETVYRAGCVLGATDGGALRRLLADKKKLGALSLELDGAPAKKLLFAVNRVLPEAAVPRGMGEQVLFVHDDAELSPLLVQVATARKTLADGQTVPSEGTRVVTAGCFVPASARELGEDHLEVLAGRLFAALDALMPFSREKALLDSAPYLDAGGVRGSRLVPHPLYAFEPAEGVLGITGLHPRTPSKGLLLASREVLPGLGFEGEVLTGLRVAGLAQAALKRPDPLKR